MHVCSHTSYLIFVLSIVVPLAFSFVFCLVAQAHHCSLQLVSLLMVGGITFVGCDAFFFPGQMKTQIREGNIERETHTKKEEKKEGQSYLRGMNFANGDHDDWGNEEMRMLLLMPVEVARLARLCIVQFALR